ncbi:hypothetical protein L6270_02530 [Candidatus Parcubacteria bacterium]|nr:hypothetical protein [Patescibacteria group bacterium]MBU4309534.1 hypothetical protein [Patescibacteria group bacterium]MBU4432355.1 hypothetical protein [Patescibacteria group bacterium]MBU4577240.1 hypothetical protein [Patescibacteria group bacterium]MCG2696886.1 hypothetical protein [Candidatus Parcubacteria bacterium]
MHEDFKKKIKILLLLLGGLLLAFLAFFLLNFLRKPVVTNLPLENNSASIAKPIQQTATSSSVVVKEIVKKPLVLKRISKGDVEKMAASFAERFGTYSNQAGFSNMVDLKIFMSRSMQIWADDYVSKQTKVNNDIYYGITTKAVVVETKNFNDELGQATVLVKTRRREATMTTANVSKVFNQDITVNVVKEDGAWKINSAYWDKE